MKWFKVKRSKTELFRKFLISYIFVLCIPMILGALVYNKSVEVVEEYARESRLNMLNNTKGAVDIHLMNINETAAQISLNPKLKRILLHNKVTESSPEIYDVWDFFKDINSYSLLNNTFDTSFYILLKNSDMVISHDKIVYGIQQFYKNEMNYSNVPYENWLSQYFQGSTYKEVLSARKAKIRGNTSSVITYLYKMPPGAANSAQYVIAFIIKEKELEKLFKTVAEDENSWFCILDESGKIISGNYPKGINIGALASAAKNEDGFFHKPVHGEDTIFVYTRSDSNKWLYLSAIPTSSVMKKAKYIEKISYIVTSMILLVGLVISFILAYRNSKPFKEIVSSLRDFFKNERVKNGLEDNLNEYEFIQGGIKNLISNNQNLQGILKRQSITIENIFIDKLLRGDLDSDTNIDTLLSHVGINIKGFNYAVTVIRINKHEHLINERILKELDILRGLIEDVVSKNMGDNAYTHVLNENEIALILNLSTPTKEESIVKITEIIENVSNEFIKQYHITPIFGVGDIYEKLADIHYSFIEALQSLNYLFGLGDTDKKMIWFSQIKEESTGYFYPTNLELKLMTLAKAGNWPEIEGVLKRIYAENFLHKSLGRRSQTNLVLVMRATVVKILDELETDTDTGHIYYKLNDSSEADKAFHDIWEAYSKICDLSKETRNNSSKQTVEKFKKYIDANFGKSDLNVAQIASHFNLSESYFSQLFKEHAGENFSAYLENVRIKQACTLILEGTLSIEEIAYSCGYNSTHSFRRAFKRVVGVVPSEYK